MKKKKIILIVLLLLLMFFANYNTSKKAEKGIEENLIITKEKVNKKSHFKDISLEYINIKPNFKRRNSSNVTSSINALNSIILEKIYYRDLAIKTIKKFTKANLKTYYFIKGNLLSACVSGYISSGSRSQDIKNFVNYDFKQNARTRFSKVINKKDFINVFCYEKISSKPRILKKFFKSNKKHFVEQCYVDDFSEFYFDKYNIYLYLKINGETKKIFITLPYKNHR